MSATAPRPPDRRSRASLPTSRGSRRARARRGRRRGVALIMVLGAISILTVLLAELQDEASSEAAAAIADRDALRAEYAARSGVNLSRLLIATEPTIRTAIGPLLSLMMGSQGAPQIPVWEFSDQVLGAFNDGEGNASFQALAGVNLKDGKNLGMKGARFEVSIVDEDSKINVNVAARGDAITQQRVGMELLGLMAGEQNNPLFENRDAEGQFSDRATICGALVDWADPDENGYGCDPRNAQNQATLAEDGYYQALKVPYRRKNAAYDSLDELHLVRGVSDDFYATFIDPDPNNPKKRVVTVWGQGTVNVNTANAQTLLGIVCGAVVQNPPQQLCVDPLAQAKFLTTIGLLRTFTAGAPLFPSPKSFVNAMKGQGMFGKILKEMIGLEPVVFFSDSEVQKMVSTESKIFSIYSDGVVPGYRRTTRVRVHAVVDFRGAPPPGDGFAGILPPGATAAPGGSGAPAAPPVPAPTGTVQTTGPNGAGAGASAEALAGALAPNPGGSIVYFRVE